MANISNSVQSWSPTVQIPATLMHAVAILATIFRLLYRWHLSRFWWEDTWATLALICDIVCLASIWMQTAPTIAHAVPQINREANWLVSLAITSVLWFARMSILCSIVRIANPTPKLRRIAYCIGIVFLAMEAGLLAQKIFICMKNLCRFTNAVAVAQLVTDVVSDIILVAAPVRFLRNVKLPRNRRILILSAFSASILITVVTIFHSILLFEAATNATLIIGHTKAALALLVCNALVLVTFVYRLCQKSGVDLDYSMAEGCGAEVGSSAVEFTSVIDLPSKFSSRVHPLTSGIQSRGDIAHTETLTLDMSAGPELDPSHTEKPTAFRGTEDSRGDYHVCKVGDASDKQL